MTAGILKTTADHYHDGVVTEMYRVLFVDDESSIRALYQLELEGAGYLVRTAGNCRDALRLLADWNPHVAILDIKLGAESGLDLLRQVSEEYPSVRTLLLTAYSGYMDDFTSWLADVFILKTADTTQLLNAMNDLLSAHPIGS